MGLLAVFSLFIQCAFANPPIVITSVSATSATVGTTITIEGTGFIDIGWVTFSGDTRGVSSSFTVVSETQITAPLPAGAPLFSVVTIGGPNAPNIAHAPQSIENLSIPMSITSISPTSGAVGSSVLVCGVALHHLSAVRFNGMSAVYNYGPFPCITATVPAGVTSGPISVTSARGTVSSSASFSPTVTTPTSSSPIPRSSAMPNPQASRAPLTIPRAYPPITVTSVSSLTATAGTTLTIDGTGFIDIDLVRFTNWSTGAADATAFTIVSPTRITATFPRTAPLFSSVYLRNPGGNSGHTTPQIENLSIPMSITSISPTSGAVGSSVVVCGVALHHLSAVRFNGMSAVYTYGPFPCITATVPAGVTSGPISVTSARGTVSSSASFLPVAASVSPSSSSLSGSAKKSPSGLK